MTKRTLVRASMLVTADDALGDIADAEILIADGAIVAVGSDLGVTDAEIIDLTGSIVTPGLVEAHNHMWQGALRGVAHEYTTGWEYFQNVHVRAGRFSPDDTYAATYSVAVELLSFGVTTVFDYCHAVNSPAHADASLAALADSGIRGVFANSFRDRPEYPRRAFADLTARIADLERLHGELADGGRVSLAVALNNIEEVDEATNRRELEAARRLGLIAAVHSNFPGQVDLLDERGLLGPDIQWVHGQTMTDAELDKIEASRGILVITPEIEMMNGVYPQTGRALRRDITVGLGSDIPSNMNGDILFQVRAGLQIERARVNRDERGQGRGPAQQNESAVTARSMLGAATHGGAQAVGLGGVTGRIAPGMKADLVAWDMPFGLSQGDPAAHVVFQSHPSLLSLVMVDGRVLKRRESPIVDVDYERMRNALDVARRNVGGGPGTPVP